MSVPFFFPSGYLLEIAFGIPFDSIFIYLCVPNNCNKISLVVALILQYAYASYHRLLVATILITSSKVSKLCCHIYIIYIPL